MTAGKSHASLNEKHYAMLKQDGVMVTDDVLSMLLL